MKDMSAVGPNSLYIVGWNRGGELSMVIKDRDRDELARISRPPCNEGVCFFGLRCLIDQEWCEKPTARRTLVMEQD